MGSLAEGLASHAERLSSRPRIYVDANVPAGLVAYMRERLRWDVLFVLEEPDLRRAPDTRHYQLAFQLRRTLITLDRDYLDDHRFPPAEGAGVLVIQSPGERELAALMSRVDRELFQRPGGESVALPVAGRKLQLHTDWARHTALQADESPSEGQPDQSISDRSA